MQTLLLIEDDIAFGKMLENFLSRNQYNVTHITNGGEVLKNLSKQNFDLILCDIRLPDCSGLDVLEEIKSSYADIPVIMMTGYADVSTAVKAMKKGAADYISKPFVPDEVLLILANCLQQKNVPPQKQQENKKEIPEAKEILFGTGKASSELKKHLELVGPTDFSVLITGESGTGKEVAAKIIHQNSQRKNQAFIAVDCGAVPKDLAASEFFGHIKGSFTGAITDKTGHFEAANGGTIFLDEVGNLSYENQIQLLRALQERKIKRIGSNTEINVDIRVIAATNEDLKEAVKNGSFREDLFHRLNEFSINIPSLRERNEDILLFAEFFLEKANQQLNKNVVGFSTEVIRLFHSYHWPGNLRELQNVIKRATLLSQSNFIEKEAIPSDFWDESSDVSFKGLTKSEAEKEVILKALAAAKGNKSEAAKLLEINRKTLYNKLKLYDLE